MWAGQTKFPGSVWQAIPTMTEIQKYMLYFKQTVSDFDLSFKFNLFNSIYLYFNVFLQHETNYKHWQSLAVYIGYATF